MLIFQPHLLHHIIANSWWPLHDLNHSTIYYASEGSVSISSCDFEPHLLAASTDIPN